jgi:UTP-glucose-1-phosphate uridylyltransferase
VLQGRRFDTGDKIGFLEATLHYALKKDPEAVRKVLKKFVD